MAKTPQEVIDVLNEYVPGKMSRNEFCRQTKINPNSFDRYVAGIGFPTLETFQKLSDFSGVSFEIKVTPRQRH